MRNLIKFVFLLIIIGCASKRVTFIEPIENTSLNLYAFVGKKISVEEFDPNLNNEEITIDSITGEKTIKTRYIMDYGYIAKYLLIENVFNNLNRDTIEFLAYDHYGRPGFEDYDTVLLYISKSKNEEHYFHQKYQYDQMFTDKKGRYYTYPKFLGTMYSAYKDSLNGFNSDIKNVKYPINHIDKENLEVYYPKKFYSYKDGFAYPTKGVYLNEIINYRLKTMFKNL